MLATCSDLPLGAKVCTQLSPDVVGLLDKALPAFTGLLGAVIGAGAASWFASRRERTQRQHAFIEKQLSEFYSPMLGLRAELKAHGELRVRLQNEAGEAWRVLTEGVAPGPEAMALTAGRFPEFEALIEYDNKKLIERLLPCYRKMVDLFRDNLWLAEEETRKHYLTLIEFVDIWERWIAKSLPVEVLGRIEHGEVKLHPLYQHIQEQHAKLRALIAMGV